MLRMLYCLHRLPSLSLAQFHSYWSDVHAPLVRRHASTIGLKYYCQHHSLDDEVFQRMFKGRAQDEAYDGVAELCWESKEAFLSGGGDPAIKTANMELLADELRFIDVARSPIFVTKAFEVIPLDRTAASSR